MEIACGDSAGKRIDINCGCGTYRHKTEKFESNLDTDSLCSSRAQLVRGLDLEPKLPNRLCLFLSNLLQRSKFKQLSVIILIHVILGFSLDSSVSAIEAPENQSRTLPIVGNEDFTFTNNGSFLQIDAGREWPFNSKREISFRFKTKSPHGLLIYQTFDHNKLFKEDDQESIDIAPPPPPPMPPPPPFKSTQMTTVAQLPSATRLIQEDYEPSRIEKATRRLSTRSIPTRSSENTVHFDRSNMGVSLPSSTITATASDKLVNSLFSSSPIAVINGNGASFSLQPASRVDKSILTQVNGATAIVTARDSSSTPRNRLLGNMAASLDSAIGSRISGINVRASGATNDGSTVLSSSAISSFSASLYELYLKLENGRLKIMYEFGSRLNQTYCGKGLNDDRWHKVDLKVDPEINQMILILDQTITVEIVLSQLQQEEDANRRNELVFTNSVLYMGGLNNNASNVKNVRQRLYLAQFIGCIGQILLKTDQHTESHLQPAVIDRMLLVKRGCSNLCETDNYCLHQSTCVNYYTNTRCDCFGTNYEDTFCWQDKLTTLSMLGYSTLVYRIYDWRDRHHSSINRVSMQFKTLASDSTLFFAYGDLSAQQVSRANSFNAPQASNPSLLNTFQIAPVNISSMPTIHRPNAHSFHMSNNYLSISLSNGSLVAEVNFGDQPVLLSNILYEKMNDLSRNNNTNLKLPSLSDGKWHNITLLQSNKQVMLSLDNITISYTITSKNNHLYFDPSIYIGGIPNLLINETRTLLRPLNIRHKFVGCLKSVYFNQHNILLALKQGSPMTDYRSIVEKPLLDTCITPEPSSLPMTLRSGKSYLTFQLSLNNPSVSSLSKPNTRLEIRTTNQDPTTKPQPTAIEHASEVAQKKITLIEFEYKTSLRTHFLAGGHLRDLSYHDLGGFWTLHAREYCQLFFTISSGLTFDPEQVLELSGRNRSCNPGSWYKVSVLIMSGDKVLNITRTRLNAEEDVPSPDSSTLDQPEHGSFTLSSSVELLHQVQLGGDLAKFGESSSLPFSGCIRRIRINGHSFDSRDFVTSSAAQSPSPPPLPPPPSPLLPSSPGGSQAPMGITNQQNSSSINYIVGGGGSSGVSSGGPISQDVISSRTAQGYVTIDSCQLVNPCISLNPCKNNGVCKINELGEPECDCSKTGYTGKRCHFSIYKQSCQDIYSSGQRKSSFYLIDLDRNGPLKPVRVRCNMEEGPNGQVETTLLHNLPAEYFIRRSKTSDIYLDITYLAFHHMYTNDGLYVHNDSDPTALMNQEIMLRSLIGQSFYCRQYFRYDCKSAPLDLGNKTWMEVPHPKRHSLTSLDGANNGLCACASSEKKCLNPRKNCNCDSGESIWSDDSFEYIGQDQVGLTRIVLLKYDSISLGDGDIEPQSRFTLSDLKCYGTREHGNQHEITFKTSDAYIEVPGWRRGDISFSFRTASNPPAIILYQLATSRNHGYFRLTLISDIRLLFEFIVNRRPRRLFLTSSHKLNNGQWQQVFIEYDQVNLRLTVNDDSMMVDLDTNDHLGTFEGPMFIGGAPSKYLIGDHSKRNGFTGCFKGLNIDSRSINLNSYLSPSMPTVINGCKPSCSKNLCQNGGKCIEYWGSYECECSNPIAHSGNNCEINLNTNSITFITQESHYVQDFKDSLQYPSHLIKNILLNIRTYQETALVLYANDHANNFIQLHKNGSSLVLTFNSNSTIVTAQVPIDDETSHFVPPSLTNPLPTPIATVVAPVRNEQSPNSTTTTTTTTAPSITNSSASLLSSNLMPMTSGSNQTSVKPAALNGLDGITPTSSQNISPLDASIRASNTSGSGQPIQIKIERHRLRTTFYVNNNILVLEKPMVFLTNYTQNPWINPEQELVRPLRARVTGKAQSRIFLANIDEHFSTRLPGFTGCIQGLSIDNQLFDFNRAHLTGELRGDYKIGCKMHCDSFPCKNQGTCVENWKEDRIQCKCDSTSYVGRLCDEDIAAVFNGQSSYFVYHLTKKLLVLQAARRANGAAIQLGSSTNRQPAPAAPTKIELQGQTQIVATPGQLPISDQPPNIIFDETSNNLFELSLAFSSEANQTHSEQESSSVQVLVLITRANSSRHFFLGLTSDGSLLIQEDYGNSMSLSRLIKKPDQPYNDGHRHMINYSRFNQTIQIIVDHQTYLPTMSVITTNPAHRFSKISLISVGSIDSGGAGSQNSGSLSERDQHQVNNYSTYSGCISNLLIKLDDISIEPLSEAFGQNLEIINLNSTKSSAVANNPSDNMVARPVSDNSGKHSRDFPASGSLQGDFKLASGHDDYNFSKMGRFQDSQATNLRLLNVVNRDSGKEVLEDTEIIVAKDVEQGKCAAFKRVEVANEKRSINEPRNTHIIDPRPVYMDPPRIKMYKRKATPTTANRLASNSNALFYCSLTLLFVIGTSVLAYAYVLQVRYKSEKFRCETPFFHKRDESTSTPIPIKG